MKLAAIAVDWEGLAAAAATTITTIASNYLSTINTHDRWITGGGLSLIQCTQKELPARQPSTSKHR